MTSGQWFRSHGNENWQFDAEGYMAERHASINDVPIGEGRAPVPLAAGSAAGRAPRPE